MEKIVEQGLLYDFYGELLTDHQRHVYEDVVFNDMSLSEIAEEQGISQYREFTISSNGATGSWPVMRKSSEAGGEIQPDEADGRRDQRRWPVQYKKNGDMSLIDRIEAISEEIGQL